MPIGPVQLLVISFDKPDFSGEILEELNRLRENEVIRLIDALAVQKNLDGSLSALQWSDLSIEEAEGLGATVGALIGLGVGGDAAIEAGAIAGRQAGSDGHLIDEAEVWDVADSIEPGSAAAIALIEHIWALPLRAAIAKAGGVAVSDEWVHPLDLVEIGLKTVSLFQPERHRLGAESARERRIDGKARIRIEHFVARFDERHHPERQRHLAAGRHKNLVGRHFDPPRPLQILGNRFAQRGNASRGHVAIAPRGKGIAHGVHHRCRRMEVRLAKLQMNN